MDIKDLPQPISRSDIYKYAIITEQINNLPTPVSREDLYLKALIDGDIDNLPVPVSRGDIYKYNTIMATMEDIPSAISRSDLYWYAICTGRKEGLPTPISRSDYYDCYLAENSAFREWETLKGYDIVVNNSRGGYAKDVCIEGMTWQNVNPSDLSLYYIQGTTGSVIRDISNNSVRLSLGREGASSSLSLKIHENNMIKSNTTYTLIGEVMSDFETTVNLSKTGYSTQESQYTKNIIVGSNFIKCKFIISTDKELRFAHTLIQPVTSDWFDKTITYKNFIILEGDYTDKPIPTNITGIESAGEKEGKINITSNTTREEIPNVVLRSLANGVCDLVDLDKGVVTRKVGKVILDGSERWTIRHSFDINTTWNCDHLKIPQTHVDFTQSSLKMLCDRFICENRDSSDRRYAMLRASGYGFIISLDKSVLDINDWLKENPTTVYYELETPYTEQITPVQIQTSSNGTTITTDNNIKGYITATVPVKQ